MDYSCPSDWYITMGLYLNLLIRQKIIFLDLILFEFGIFVITLATNHGLLNYLLKYIMFRRVHGRRGYDLHPGLQGD